MVKNHILNSTHKKKEFNTQKKAEKKGQRWKGIVQINEQCYIQKSNGKLNR